MSGFVASWTLFSVSECNTIIQLQEKGFCGIC